MNLNKILQKGLYKDIYLDLPYHNRIFVDRYQLPIASYATPELFEYHIKLFGLTKEYNKFKKEQVKINNSLSINLLDEKDNFVLNVVFDIILTARYQVLRSNIYRADFLYTLKKLNLLESFWKDVDVIFSQSNFIKLGREFADELLKPNLLNKERASGKILSLNDYITNNTDVIILARDPKLLDYITIVNNDQKNINRNRLQTSNIKELYNNNYVNNRIISIDLKTAFYQSLIIFDIAPNISINDLFAKYSTNDLFINNKPLRQIIFGNLSLRAIGSLIKYSTYELYKEIKELDSTINLYMNGEDELIIISKDESNEKDVINKALINLEFSYNKLNVGIDIYNLLKITTTYGEFFYKQYDDGKKVIKGTPVQLYPQVFKLINNKRIGKKDLWFIKDDKIVTLLKPIKLTNEKSKNV